MYKESQTYKYNPLWTDYQFSNMSKLSHNLTTLIMEELNESRLIALKSKVMFHMKEAYPFVVVPLDLDGKLPKEKGSRSSLHPVQWNNW